MAKSIRLPSKPVPIIGDYDVVVAGGGAAGLAAAVAAARHKARVLLIEQTGCLGGLGTAGLVPCFCPFSWEAPPSEKSAVQGLAMEVVRRLAKMGGTDLSEWPSLDAEKLKVLYDQLAAEAGVKVRFFSLVSDVVVEKGRIKAVILESKAGRQAVTARLFIDATGDADLAARAGSPIRKGDQRGLMQSVTLCFTLAGVDTRTYFAAYRKRFENNRNMTNWLQGCQRRGKLPAVADCEYRMIAQKKLADDTLGLNFGHVFGLDGTAPDDLTRGMILGRQLAHNFVDFARQNISGMKNAHIVATGSILGVRETRRVQGRSELTLEDFRASQHGVDDIAMYDYPVDVHPSSGRKQDTGRTERQMESLVQPAGKSYGIHWGCLLPRKIDNLLVAGRSISADRMMQGSSRVMPAAIAMGQAAGTAAALCVRKRLPPAKLDVAELRKVLAKDGARIE